MTYGTNQVGPVSSRLVSFSFLITLVVISPRPDRRTTFTLITPLPFNNVSRTVKNLRLHFVFSIIVKHGVFMYDMLIIISSIFCIKKFFYCVILSSGFYNKLQTSVGTDYSVMWRPEGSEHSII